MSRCDLLSKSPEIVGFFFVGLRSFMRCLPKVARYVPNQSHRFDLRTPVTNTSTNTRQALWGPGLHLVFQVCWGHRHRRARRQLVTAFKGFKGAGCNGFKGCKGLRVYQRVEACSHRFWHGKMCVDIGWLRAQQCWSSLARL